MLMPSRFWCAASSLSLLCVGCADEPERGELMLSITTDMAVPNDIDRIDLSVTLAGETVPFAQKTIVLEQGTDLPVTLAIEDGPATSAAIAIRVEGRKGADTSILRVAREARVVVPKSRVARLDLPLSFLCSDAALREPCESGKTCEAGHCVSPSIATASLPDFQPRAAARCYDVTACLPNATLIPVGPITLKSGQEVPCGLVGTTLLGPDANVNLALQVSNERVGNYGFCGPFGECFIPLHRNATSEGWHVLDNGDTPAIELPSAVCESLEQSLTRVAVVRASPSCPSDRGEQPLCSPPQRKLCLPAPVCPPTSEEPSWAGYACSTATPDEDHPDLLKCWSPNAPDSEGATPEDGRWCCLRAQESSQDPLLIDDMTGGPQIKLAPPEGQFAGWWSSDVPGGSGRISPPPQPSLFTYRQFPEPVGPADGPKFRAAACLSSPGVHGWFAIESFFFASKRGVSEATALDVSQYAGLSFWGWAPEPFPDSPLGVQVNFPNVQTSTEPGSECMSAEDGPSRCENFFKEVSLTEQWKHYVVRWEDLRQGEEDWGQIYFTEFKPQLYAVYFSVKGAGPKVMSQPFEFCVADIRFEARPEPPP